MIETLTHLAFSIQQYKDKKNPSTQFRVSDILSLTTLKNRNWCQYIWSNSPIPCQMTLGKTFWDACTPNVPTINKMIRNIFRISCDLGVAIAILILLAGSLSMFYAMSYSSTCHRFSFIAAFSHLVQKLQSKLTVARVSI